MRNNKLSPHTPVQAGREAGVRRHAPGRPCPHFPHLSAPPGACPEGPEGFQSQITTWKLAWHRLVGVASTAGRVQTFMTSPGKICLGRRQRLGPASEDSGKRVPPAKARTQALLLDEMKPFASLANSARQRAAARAEVTSKRRHCMATCACRIEASMSWRLLKAKLSV